jgi:hypothetical protein
VIRVIQKLLPLSFVYSINVSDGERKRERREKRGALIELDSGFFCPHLTDLFVMITIVIMVES